MPKAPARKAMSVRMRTRLVNRLTAEAEKMEVSRSELIEYILMKHLGMVTGSVALSMVQDKKPKALPATAEVLG